MLKRSELEPKGGFPNFLISSKNHGEFPSLLNPNFSLGCEKFVGIEFKIPPEVVALCQEIRSYGGRALLVGGSVRDAAINHFHPECNLDPKDYDLEICGLPQKVIQKLLERKFGLHEVETLGESFGIIQVSIPGWKEKLDTSVPRRESKIGKGHLGFKVEGDPSMTIVEAAKRRDIAINSLAYDPLTGIIYDSFGGLNDIKNKIIRATDGITFQEDPLRVLRIAQFAARFNFAVADETLILCTEMVSRGDLEISTFPTDGTKSRKSSSDKIIRSSELESLFVENDFFLIERTTRRNKPFRETVLRKLEKKEVDGLSKNRTSTEFGKLLMKGTKPSVGLEFMRKIGYVERYLPELHALINIPQEPGWHPEGDVWTHTLQVLDAAADIAQREGLKDNSKLAFMLGAICHDLGKASTTTRDEDGKIRSRGHEEAGIEPTKAFLAHFNFDKSIEPMVVALVRYHMDPKKFWMDGTKHNIKMDSAIRRRAVELEKHGTHWYTLALIAEADQRGRNGKGTHPLDAHEVLELEEWKTWLFKKIEHLNVRTNGPKLIVTGMDLISHLNLPIASNGGDINVGIVLRCLHQDQIDGNFASLEDALAIGARYYANMPVSIPKPDLARHPDPRIFFQL